MRATTCTSCPAAKVRPGIMASAGVRVTSAESWLSRRLAASGGPACAGVAHEHEQRRGRAAADGTRRRNRDVHAHHRSRRCPAAAAGGVVPPASFSSSALICCSMQRPHVRRRIHRQQLREALPGQLQVAAARGERGAEEQRLARVRVEHQRALDQLARHGPSSSVSSLSASASACPMSASTFLPAAHAVGALEGAQRQRILLQHQVRAAEHQPAIESSSGRARAGAPGARPWSAASRRRGRGVPRPVAPGGVQQRRADDQDARRARAPPRQPARRPVPARSSGSATPARRPRSARPRARRR